MSRNVVFTTLLTKKKEAKRERERQRERERERERENVIISMLEIENSKSCVPVVKLSLTLIKTSHPLPRWIELGRACI